MAGAAVYIPLILVGARGDVRAAVRAAAPRRAGGGDPAPALDASLALGGDGGRARRADLPDARERARAAAAARAGGVDGAAALVGARARRARRCSSCSRCSRSRRGRSATRSSSTASSRSRRSSAPRWPAPTTTRRGSTRRTRPRGGRSSTSRSTATSTRASSTTPEPEVEDILRARSKAYIRKHPTYVAKVAEWTTLRMFELGGLDWSRHTASTISVTAGWANAGRDLLLGVRAARAGGRVHEARAADAAVRVDGPGPALPERRLPGGRDAALPDRDRPVHRHARGAGATTSTSRRRGPCTPSTRSSSMSEVADGPETSVIGRPCARRPRASAATASGTDGDDLRLARRRTGGRSGTSVSARRPERRAAVEHDRAGLGDRRARSR